MESFAKGHRGTWELYHDGSRLCQPGQVLGKIMAKSCKCCHSTFHWVTRFTIWVHAMFQIMRGVFIWYVCVSFLRAFQDCELRISTRTYCNNFNDWRFKKKWFHFCWYIYCSHINHTPRHLLQNYWKLYKISLQIVITSELVVIPRNERHQANKKEWIFSSSRCTSDVSTSFNYSWNKRSNFKRRLFLKKYIMTNRVKMFWTSLKILMKSSPRSFSNSTRLQIGLRKKQEVPWVLKETGDYYNCKR